VAAECLKATFRHEIARILAGVGTGDSEELEEPADATIGWQLVADFLFIIRKALTK
jgi:hypothetical protein